ncbi:MAG: hypothetical protein RLZ04_2169 [Actinomycetota bacterium]
MSTRWTTRRSPIAGLFIALSLALTTVGCSAEDSESASVPSSAGSGDSSGGGEVPTENEGGEPDGEPTATERDLIIRITVGLEVDDVDTAVDEVIALAASHGGELSASTVDMYDERYASGDLVFRLPPSETDAFITALESGIGRRTSLNSSTEDVTLQLTDLETRLQNARASLDRVRALLADAVDLGDVIALESELTQRQTTLEQLMAEKAYVDGLVAMSTVTVHLTTRGDVVDDDGTGIGDAFRDGWNAFTDALHGLVVLLGRTLPFLVAIGLAGLAALGIRRRVGRRNRSAAPLTPPAPVGDPHTSEPGS